MNKYINFSVFTTLSTTIINSLFNLASAFQLNDPWSSTAIDGNGLQQGDPITLAWSIAPDGTPIPGFIDEPDATSNLISFLDGIYGSAGTPNIQDKT